MKKQEWIERYASHLKAKGDLPIEFGRQAAESAYADMEDDEPPEDAADVEMSYWER